MARNFRNLQEVQDKYPDGFTGELFVDLDPVPRSVPEIKAGARPRYVSFIELDGEVYCSVVAVMPPEDVPLPKQGDKVTCDWSDIKENEFYAQITGTVQPS